MKGSFCRESNMGLLIGDRDICVVIRIAHDKKGRRESVMGLWEKEGWR